MDIVRQMLPGVTLLKLNASEAERLARESWQQRLSGAELFTRARADIGVKVLVLTRGAEGASVFTEEGAVHAEPVRVKLASAVGAGDAFGAAFLAGWLRQQPIREALARASQIGAWVASRPEAVPDYPPAFASNRSTP